MVKRILNKYGYPPDLQEEAISRRSCCVLSGFKQNAISGF